MRLGAVPTLKDAQPLHVRSCHSQTGSDRDPADYANHGSRIVSGGLVSKRHPLGATGLAQIHKLALHLRGRAGQRRVENARLAIAENSGGFYGVEDGMSCVTIIGRV